MMTPFPPKTPMQMRLEADRPVRQKPAPAAPIDPAVRPLLHSDRDAQTVRGTVEHLDGAELDATIDWLAHIAAGRIPCPEPDEGEVR